MSFEKALSIVKSTTIDMEELEALLDAMSHDERLALTRAFSPKIQKNLFAAAQGRSVSIEQIVPTTDLRKEVIHEGMNTMPLFRIFQKRFARPEKKENREAVGFNYAPLKSVTGPGYFVGAEDKLSGEFVIDYTQLPTEKVDSWPKILSNNSKLGFLVWGGMKDRLRRLSDHVTIGRAYKKKPMNAYFVLCRVD